jgi:hypothetical protein
LPVLGDDSRQARPEVHILTGGHRHDLHITRVRPTSGHRAAPGVTTTDCRGPGFAQSRATGILLGVRGNRETPAGGSRSPPQSVRSGSDPGGPFTNGPGRSLAIRHRPPPHVCLLHDAPG